MSRFLFFAALLGFFGLNWWKAKFGIEGYDEPFYLIVGFKFLSLGDLPFQDEILNAPRSHDFLNHFLLRPWFDFEVLPLRRLSLLLQILLMGGLSVVLLPSAFWLPSLGFLFCWICFDYNFIASWSHNVWARIGFFGHFLFLALALGKNSIRPPSAWLYPFLSGFLLAIAFLAYHPLVVAWAVGVLVFGLFWGRHFFSKGLKNLAGALSPCAFLAGFMILVCFFLSYVSYHHLWSAWIKSYGVTRAIGTYSENFGLQKFQDILGFAMTRNEFWGGFLMGLGLTFRKKAYYFLGGLAFLTVFLRIGAVEWGSQTANKAVESGLVGFAWASACWGMVHYGLKQKAFFFYLSLLSALSMGAMSMASEGAQGAAFWLGFVPSLLLFRFLLIHLFRPLSGQGRVLILWSGSVFMFYWVFIAGLTVSTKLKLTYHDDPIEASMRPITVKPLEGIWTSPERALVFEWIAGQVKDSKFILALNNFPTPFYFGQARSSMDTLLHLHTLPDRAHLSSLRATKQNNRLPDLIFISKINAWTWGAERPIPTLPVSHHFDEILKCTRATTVFEKDEFVVLRPHQQRFKACLVRQLGRHPN